MKHTLLTTSLTSLLTMFCQLYGQTTPAVTNFLSIPGPINIQKKAYQLSWSSHPDVSLYKQEYLAVGDHFPNYKSMVMVDFVLTSSTVDQAVSTKMQELETMKATYPIVNANVLNNATTGEKIIDCLIGQTAADERNSLIERTVYRYKSVKTKTGQRGVLLFAVSTRAYGKEVSLFLTKLKTDKLMLLNEVAAFALPEISLPKL